MGSLWIARHVELEVDVAVKFHASSERLDARAEQRFKREAQAAAQLKSPNVVQIHDYGIDRGTAYIAMELLEGEDFGQLLEREGCLSLRRALELIGQIGKALTRAHQAGIVHRDIKPSNLFMARHADEPVVKVLDFGIAKDQSSTADGATTSVGVVLGSPAYMSPEQARGGAIDHRSDLYSLAAVLYRMVTGVPPFVGSTSNDIMIKICTDPIPKASEMAPHLPPAIDQFFERALARRPADRFRSVAEFVKDFEAIVETHPNTDRSSVERSERAIVGRSSETQSLRVPVIGLNKQLVSYRWLFAVIAASLLVAVVSLWPDASQPRQQPSNQPEAAAARADAPEPPTATKVPIADQYTEPLPTTDTTDTPSNIKPASSVSSRKAPRKSQRNSVAREPTDPVFGLPVPAVQGSKP